MTTIEESPSGRRPASAGEPTPGGGVGQPASAGGVGARPECPADTVRRRSRGWRRNRALLAALAFVFFFGPMLARAGGVHAQATENRPLRSFPSFSEGWGFLPKLDAWAIDHLPMRDKAVRTTDVVSEHVFDELPANGVGASLVTKGRDGWLFLDDDAKLACRGVPVATLSVGVARLARLMQALGKRFVFTVAPDKTSIERPMLPSVYPHQRCAEAADTAFWEGMRATPPPGYLDLYDDLIRLREQQGHAYYATDTHWTPAAAAYYATAVARQVDPKLMTGTQVVSLGPQRKKTDLLRMIGRPGTEQAEGYEIQRDGVRSSPLGVTAVNGFSLFHRTSTSSGPPLYPGKVLVLGDSFTLNTAVDQLAPFFADLSIMHFFASDPDLRPLVGLIMQSDVVVLEIVERTFLPNLSPLLQPARLDALEREISAARAAG